MYCITLDSYNSTLCKISAAIALDCFIKLNCFGNLFYTQFPTACQRIIKAKFWIPIEVLVYVEICSIKNFKRFLANLPQEYKIFPNSNPRSKISIHLFHVELLFKFSQNEPLVNIM